MFLISWTYVKTIAVAGTDAGVRSLWLWPGIHRGDGTVRDNCSMVLGAAVAGQGVAIGWRHLVDDLLAPSVLCRLSQAPLVSPCGYHLMAPQHKRQTASACSLVEWLLSERPDEQGHAVDSRHG